jgi:hypothetical protein
LLGSDHTEKATIVSDPVASVTSLANLSGFFTLRNYFSLDKPTPIGSDWHIRLIALDMF